MTEEILIGRKDWDVVAFEDYEKDTGALAERAAIMLQHERKRSRFFQSIVAQMVVDAGGQVTVPMTAHAPAKFYLDDLPDYRMSVEVDPASFMIVMRAEDRVWGGESD